MKKNPMVIFMILCILPLTCYAFDFKSDYDILVEESSPAHDDPTVIDTGKINFQKTPINKFGRGLINVTTCWGEIITECFKVSMEKDPAAASIIGVGNGLVTAFRRAGTGVYDMVTFAIPPYDKPPMKPEYALKGAEDAADAFNAKSRLFAPE